MTLFGFDKAYTSKRKNNLKILTGFSGEIIVILQKVEAIEEAFSCVLVHNLGLETEKIKLWQTELSTALGRMNIEQQENAIKQFLMMASGMTNHKRLQMLLGLLENMVTGNTLTAR